jgi:2-(1,2-epoxy-1,2-dihydrophenyl)acetyl-CoA isomerase
MEPGMEQPILVTKADGYRVITFNRPEKLNAFNERMNLDLQAALSDADQDATCRAIMITGAGRGFTAGQDLAAASMTTTTGEKPNTRDTLERLYNPIVRKIATLRMPVVCAINGVAAGAGLNIALGCDFVFAARSAKFLQPFVKIGLLPDAGGTWYLPRLIGAARTKALMISGDPITAEQAEQFGMIWKCVDDARLMDEATAMTARLAQAPTRAIAAIKRSLMAAEGNTLDQQLDLERDLQQELSGSPDNVEGIAAFIAKRTPKFTGQA